MGCRSLNRLKYVKDNLDNILYTYEYYADGNIKKVTDANTNWMEYKYNYKGKVKEVKDKLGNITTYEYGGTGCSSCGGGGDNLVKITDANLKETKFEYYKNGDRKSQTDPLNHISSFTYDPPGFMASLTDPSNAVTTFSKIDLTITKTDPLGKTTIYEYDKAGRLKNITDRNNKITHYTYTPDGVPDTITYDYPNGPFVSFTNDELDRITSMVDSLGTTIYAYDDVNRTITATDPNGFVITHKYDAAGNLLELTYPGNKKVTYTYDQLNRLKTVTNWLIQTATYNYDAAGRLTGLTNFNSTLTTYGYDIANRLASLTNKKSDNSVIATYNFTLNAVGDITQSVQDEPLIPVLSAETTSYTYNAQKTRLLSAGSDNFTYDNEGQLATGYGSTYTFDYEHRLTAISGQQTAFSYSYDGKNNRLKAIRDGVTTKYVYDMNGNLLAEADVNNIITKYFIHGRGLLAMVTPTDQVYNYHFNNIGSTIAMTDQSQAIVNKYSYDEFGKVLNQVAAVPQPFKYVGQYGVMHESNGFYYMRARYYDPKVGRFISEDPIGLAGGINQFVYVGNKPVNRIDPMGLFEIEVSDPWGRSGSTYGGTITVIGNNGISVIVNGSSWPNPTNANPGIATGTYNATYSSTGHHGTDPAVLFNGAIPTLNSNPNNNLQPNATNIQIHCGDTPTNRGSAGCITIQPDQCQQVWNLLQNGQTGTVTINRSILLYWVLPWLN